MNAPKQEQQPTESAPMSFGERIRQAREERQLSIDDLVGETRINPQHLIDLEECKTSGISAPGYIVGYLRTLAKVLELDAEELINDFKSSINQANHQTIDPEHELLPPKPKKSSLGWSTIVATTIIVLAGIGAVIYYWWDIARDENSSSSPSELVDDDQSNLNDSEGTNSSPNEGLNSTESAGQASVTSDRDRNSDYENSAMSSNVRNSGENEGTVNGDDGEVPSEFTGSGSSSAQTKTMWEELMNLSQDSSEDVSTDNDLNENVETSIESTDSEETNEATQEEPPLVFEFSEVSFIEVTDADDNQLVSETKQAGTKLELDGTAPFTIKLGFAPGVTVFFKGDKVDLTPHTRRNIAEFSLPP